MATIVGVRFKNAGKLYYFAPGQLWPTAGDAVIVETARGVEYAEVITGVREVDDASVTLPLKPVLRIATAEDAAHNLENRRREREAYATCQRCIIAHKLEMKLVSVEFTFDNNKIMFYFTANGRVDFRGLVKDLASIFKTRIELRQIGVRDEAKMMGGLGLCGRPVCCATFLGDFQPVSIKMAKEQNLSLNPTKISGVCGRLMCCLKYEEDAYETTRRQMPRIGKEVVTPDGNGIVLDINVLKETVRVRIPKGDGTEVKDYPNADVQRVIRAPIPRAAQKDEPAQAPAPQGKAPAEANEADAIDVLEPTDDVVSVDIADDVPAQADIAAENADADAESADADAQSADEAPKDDAPDASFRDDHTPHIVEDTPQDEDGESAPSDEDDTE